MTTTVPTIPSRPRHAPQWMHDLGVAAVASDDPVLYTLLTLCYQRGYQDCRQDAEDDAEIERVLTLIEGGLPLPPGTRCPPSWTVLAGGRTELEGA